ncbi:TonB-dependent receptor [Sphingomonas oligophenolica]|uniref:TonB-dependent receptor n=1 Tax=Sphingomonas oligophenolica TaxID=301154 RepID=A0ABU9Y947_9SPHN
MKAKFLLSTACLLTTIAGAAQAQDRPGGTAGQQPATDSRSDGQEADTREIVIVARKQGETAIRAPATIAIADSQLVRSQNITSANQLTGIVPGVVTQQGTSGSSVAIRGMSSSSADPSIESSVPTYVDGVYFGRTRDLVMPIYDVDHIEVIKGTQSTLLGKNTSLGALSIVNRRPGKDFGYDLTYGHSFGIGGDQAQGAINMPIGGGFAIRAAALLNHEGGYVRNAYVGRYERQVREVSGRITLSGNVTSDGSIALIYQHDDRRLKGQYFEVLADPAGAITRRAGLLGQTNFEAVGNDVNYNGSDAVGADTVAGPLPFDNQVGNKATAILSFDLGGARLTSQSAYVEWKSLRDTDADFTRANLLDLRDGENNRVISQEVRLASDTARPFSYLVGAYYYHNDWTLNRILTGQSGGGVFPLVGFSNTNLNVRTDAISGFASARYAITDTLTFSAGIRYTHEDKTATYDRSSAGFFAAPTQSPAIPHTTAPKIGAGDIGGDLGVQWHPTASTMLYASWSRGTKSGGFQANPTTLAAAQFTEEVAYTTEVGAKVDLGRRGFATIAAFNTAVKGFQVGRTQVVAGLSQTVIGNADVLSRGAEASTSLRIVNGLWVDGNVVYDDSHFTKDFPAGATPLVAYAGMPLQRAPKWTAMGAVRYQGDLSSTVRLRARAAVNYSSEYDLQYRASDPLAPKSLEHAQIDASIALLHTGTGIEVAVIGTNLTDKRYAYFTSSISAGGSAYFGSLNRPRTVALQLSIRR